MTDPTVKRPKPSPSPARSNVVGWGILSVTVGAVVAGVVGRFAVALPDLFQGFGADVPWVTTFVLNWWYGLWLIPVVAAVVCVAALLGPDVPGGQHRTVVTLALLCAAAVVLGALAMLALYTPIFSMGQVV